MVRVLITGMSGAGKTTLLAGLAQRGYRTVETDDDGWVLPDSTWDEPRMTALLAGADGVSGDGGRHLVVSGTVENQGRFSASFEHVVLLTGPLELLLERVTNRTTNPYGSTPQQREEIAHYHRTVEPLLRRGATLVLDAGARREELVDVVERLLKP